MKHLIISDESIQNKTLVLSQNQAHHLLAVCKCKANDILSAATPTAHYQIKITKLSAKQLHFQILSEEKRKKSQLPIFHLIQALPKQDKFAEICRSCTEIGVDTIRPILSQRCDIKAKKTQHKYQRWERIIESAALQSKRDHIPQLHSVQTMSEMLKNLKEEKTLKLIFWEEAQYNQLPYALLEKVQTNKTVFNDVIILIGPEGGFDKKETSACISAGFHCLSLGKNILRVEHAGFAALNHIITYLNYLRY